MDGNYTLKKKRAAKIRKDGWYNAMSGLGKKGFDKNENTYFRGGLSFTHQELSAIYTEDGLGSRIIKRPAADSFRRWFDITNDPDGKIQQQLTDLNTGSIFKTALEYARLYGGSIIIMNVDDGKLLEDEMILTRARGVNSLKVYPRPNIQFNYELIDRDPQSPTFEEPLEFIITTHYGNQFTVSRSRCLVFKGFDIPNTPNQIQRGNNNSMEDIYWGVSELYPVYENLRALTSSIKGISSILQEFVVSMYKIKDLAQVILSGNLDVLYDRMDIIHMSKSNLNGIFLDADSEDYQRNSAQVAGVSDLIEELILMLSGASGIPITLLFGRSPSGLNATGDSDIRLYYDDISAFQHNKLQQQIYPLIQLLGLLVKIKNPEIAWRPLWEPTEQEQTNARKTQAEIDQIYINNQVLGAEEIRDMRFNGVYSQSMFVDDGGTNA